MSKLRQSSVCISKAQRIEFARKGDGGSIDVAGDFEQRKELIERVTNAGEHIELRTEAVVYAQGGEYLNRDRRRFTQEALDGFARTATSTPLLLDHWRSMDEQVGYCEVSEAEADGEVLRLREILICNAPGSVLPVLRGPVCFSMGWSCDWETVLCSYCKSTILDCGHLFWGYEYDKGERVPIYWTFTDTMADERSLVTVPQAAGTGTEGWEQLTAAFSAELDLCRAQSRPIYKERNTMSLKELAKQIGLDGEVNEQTIVLEFKRMSALADERGSKIDELTGQIKALEAKNAELDATVASHEKAEREAECAALVGELVEGGYIRAEGSAAELIAECYAAGNIDYAKKLAASYRDRSPTADEPVAKPEEPASKPELEARQTPPGAVLAASKGSQATETPVEPDWTAAFARLPQHVREMAGAQWAKDPKRYFQRNPARALELGISL